MGEDYDKLLIWRNFRRVEFQQAVAPVRDVFDFEESLAQLNRACHHGAIDEKRHVSPRRAFEESANDGGVIKF